MIEPPRSTTGRQISPDGMWEWNGTKWMPAQAPPGPQQVAQSAPLVQLAPPTKAKKRRRWPWIVGGLIGLIVVGAVISNAASGTKQPSAQSNASPQSQASTAPKATPVVAPPPVAPAAIAPIVLTGTGQQATHFTATQGLSVFTAMCSCSGNFVVELDDSNGKMQDIPINVIGQYSGSLGEPMSAGDQILKVTADAAWTVTITQPRNVSGAALPQTYTSTGQQIVGPFKADQAVGIKAHNAGSSNFVVSVIDRNGKMTDIPINEIGNYDGSTISNSLSGGPTYYLNVDSDGTWTITVSKP